MTTCQTCPRPLRPDEQHRTACHRCEDHMRAWLREIALQQPLLQASLHRGRDQAPTATRNPGHAHAPLPARDDVLSLLGPAAPGPVRDTQHDQDGPIPVHAVLHAWADRIADHRQQDLLPLRNGHDYTPYLAAHLPLAVTRDWYHHMHTEIRDLVTRIRSITATRPRRHHLDAPCPGCAAFALVREDWQTYIDCEACGRLYTHDEYDQHAATVMPGLYRTALLLAAHACTDGQEESQAVESDTAYRTPVQSRDH